MWIAQINTERTANSHLTHTHTQHEERYTLSQNSIRKGRYHTEREREREREYSTRQGKCTALCRMVVRGNRRMYSLHNNIFPIQNG